MNNTVLDVSLFWDADACALVDAKANLAKADLLTSMTVEEFDAYEGPSVDELRDAMERGRRRAARAFPKSHAARVPRRTLPEDP